MRQIKLLEISEFTDRKLQLNRKHFVVISDKFYELELVTSTSDGQQQT